MEDYRLEEQKEIVLTYRPGERIEPVELRYERELPERMRPQRAQADPGPLPERREEPAWHTAIAPPEKKKGSGNWGARIFVVVSVLVLVTCLGLGGWYVMQNGWSISRAPSGGGPDRWQVPEQEGPSYYWQEEDVSDAETTIRRYPTGGSARLELTSDGEADRVLTPGEVFEKVNPSVVTVFGGQSDSYSVGTGVLFTEDGYLLTNFHVVAGSSECVVWVPGANDTYAIYEAQLVGYDEENDLAVLKIDGQDLPAAEFGVSDELKVGDPVYAIGNPLGVELRNTFTNGIVSAVDREVDVDGVSMTLLQTNTALNSGNSGGPLINQYGQVVGINTIKMMSDYDTIEGLGFAIPSSFAVRWVNEIIQYGAIQPQPLLGLTISRIPETLPDGTPGLRVEEVSAGLGGAKAGVKVGDYVVSFAGREVSSTQEILRLRRELCVGDQVPIRVYRDGEYLDLTMVMMAPAD